MYDFRNTFLYPLVLGVVSHPEATVTMVLLIYCSSFKMSTVNNDYYIVRFMKYPYLNLVMNSIRILNNNEISLNFRLIYFMTSTV